MFILVTTALLAGLALILLLSRSSATVAAERDYFQPEGSERQGPEERLTPEQFERLCIRLLEQMGLVITSMTSNAHGQIDFTAVNPQPITGGEYIVHCLLASPDEPIDLTQLVALSDTVRAEGASKGILLTTGFFSEEALKPVEGPLLEVINGHRLRQILVEHRIPLT